MSDHTCSRCESQRVCDIFGKCSDAFAIRLGEISRENDYVPGDFGIGGGDYIEFLFCMDCGQIQGEFPRPETELERGDEDE